MSGSDLQEEDVCLAYLLGANRFTVKTGDLDLLIRNRARIPPRQSPTSAVALETSRCELLVESAALVLTAAAAAERSPGLVKSRIAASA
jgi:hypothetical protein